MNISYRWLQDFVKTTRSASELADKFRMTSSEVEGITDWGEKLASIVVGEILEIHPHPDADRLQVTTVDTGNQQSTIVTAAKNVSKGMHVIVALPGAQLTPLKEEPFTIQVTKLRGVTSEGMFCGPDSLGINVPMEGVWEVAASIKPGTPASEALELNDWVLDLEITPNRPDLLSYYGLAREVAAFDKKRLAEPEILPLESSTHTGEKQVEVLIENHKGCLRYSALCVENIKPVASPWWLQARLILAGVKPINCIVDVTNYVMLELGQPMHAFDLDKLPQVGKRRKLIVRNAQAGEKLAILDGTTRTLHQDDLIIANAHNEPIDLAGIMGGTDASISSTTTRVFLESATFHGPQIRRTSRRLGLRSEASSRFEKGLDPEQTVTALKRAAYLLEQCCQAEITEKILDIYPTNRAVRPRIHLTFDRIQQVLGVHISAHEAKSILQQLGFQIPLLTKSSFEVIPPSWRKDVSLPEDVIEELIRMWGYERIPSTLPTGVIKAPEPNTRFERLYSIRQHLAAAGLFESLHIPFTSGVSLKKTGLNPQQAVRLPNPLSAELEYLAPSHLPALLESMAGPNLDQEEIGFFEIGRVFTAPKSEQQILTIMLRSNSSPELLYRRLKGVLESMSNYCGLPLITYKTAKADACFTKDSVHSIEIAGKQIGSLGQINPEIVASYKIRRGREVVAAIIDVEGLLAEGRVQTIYQAPVVYPSIERDLTLIVENTLPVAAITELVEKKLNSDIILNWAVKDVYTGKPLTSNQKAVTLHFTYNGRTRTLEDTEASQDQQRLISFLRKELNAIINE